MVFFPFVNGSGLGPTVSIRRWVYIYKKNLKIKGNYNRVMHFFTKNNLT
jgi:hypothetical protein